MSMSSVAAPPARVTLTNLEVNETLEVQFNPTELRSNLAVEYARKGPHGGVGQRLHYGGTGNRVWPEIEFFFIGDTVREVGRINDARLFLESLCYRPRTERSPAASTPLVLFIWPSYVAATVRVVSHSDIADRFSKSGQPTGFKVRMTFEEVLEEALTMEDVRIAGYQRGDWANFFG